MVQKFQDWQAKHPDVPVDGDGRWLVYKPCLNKAQRFVSYFPAEFSAARRDLCRCRQAHYIVELAKEPAPIVSEVTSRAAAPKECLL